MASAALCTDVLGSARVPAACCGVYAYRATPGAVGHANAAASDSSPEGIESVALMTADPGVLLKGGQALGAPGGLRVRLVRNYDPRSIEFTSKSTVYKQIGDRRWGRQVGVWDWH